MQKKYLMGFETECFILDNEGRISCSADKLLEQLRSVAKKECAKNMIEVVSRPAENISGVVADVMKKIRALMEIAEKNDNRIFYYGTYPGAFNPEMRQEGGYGIKEKIFGKWWPIAGRCAGFHCHYTLTHGLFNKVAKNLRLLMKFGANQAFVDSYNMLIALDPVFSTFLQSSPFYQGRYYGKDSRMLFYRGNLGVEGLYTKLPAFGALPEYKHIITDIMYAAEERLEQWEKLIKAKGISADVRRLYGSAYDINWSPVKVNPIGTFELRGMDMNRFLLLVSSAVLIRYAIKALHEEGLTATVDELAIIEPFKIEDGRVHIPPFAHLKMIQNYSAKQGLENKTVRKYCSSFLDFMAVFLPRDRKKFLKPFRKMVSGKRTISDEILSAAGKAGDGKSISKEEAAEISLKLTENIFSDIEGAEKAVENLS